MDGVIVESENDEMSLKNDVSVNLTDHDGADEMSGSWFRRQDDAQRNERFVTFIL